MNGVVISAFRNTSNNSRFVIEVREHNCESEAFCKAEDINYVGTELIEAFHDVFEWQLIKRRNQLCEKWSEKVNVVVANPLPEMGAKQ